MSLFAEGMFSYLSTGGTDAGTRIYPNALPQGVVLPAIRYTLVSDPPERTHSGPSQLHHPKYQLDCVMDGNEAYLNAHKLANQIIALVDGYVGAMGDYTVHAGFKDERRDSFDSETGRYAVQVDLIFWHNTP